MFIEAYRGKEVFERLSDDEEEVNRSKHPGEWVFCCLGNTTPIVSFIILADTTSRNVSAVLCHGTLLQCEVVGASIRWPVGEEPEAKEGHED